MKFWTIWTIPSMTVLERALRSREWAAMYIAAILPQRIRYWVAIQQLAHATRYSEEVPGATVDEILPNLQRPKNIH